MARFDLGNVLGAVLGGGKPARAPRRRTTTRGSQQDLARALGALAGAAIEAWQRSSQQPPAPAPAPPPRRTTKQAAGWDTPVPAKTPRGSVPQSGPWGAPPASKPAPAPRAPEGWAPIPGAPPPPPIPAEDREGLLMLRAMVAAARADGQVDAEERGRIAEQLDAAGLGPAARDAVLAEFDRGAAPEALAREARDPMLAAQIYAAAVAGAGSIEGAERAWLDGFAKALKLDRAATEAIERRIRGG